MKKIINNKLYNTDTAESLGQKEWGEPTDFYYIFESLYRTSKGNFFLYRKVGAGSEFAKPIGNNSWVPREDIETLDKEQTRNWAIDYLEQSKFEEIFGVIEEA